MTSAPEKLDLLNESLPQLLRKTSIPAITGMVFGTLYNIIDTIYAGLLSTDALAGLTLSFPVFFLIVLAVAVGYSNGLKAVIGYELGKKNEACVGCLISQGIALGLILGLLVNIPTFLLIDTLFAAFEGTENAKDLAKDYTMVILLGGIGMNLMYALLAPLGAIGDNKTLSNGEIVAALANVALNPVLMFGWFGLPALGISGLALATVIIWFGFAAYVAYRLMHSELKDYITLASLRPNPRLMVQIIKQSIPNIINMLRIGVLFSIFAFVMSRYGTHVVAGYGIGFRIEGLIILPVIGLNVATMALFAQNYGAGNFERVKSLYILALKVGLGFMIAGGVFLYFAAPLLAIPFTEDTITRALAVEYLRIDAVGLGAIAIINLSIAMLQGMQKSLLSIIILLFTQVLTPGILLTHISTFGTYKEVWWTMVGLLWLSALCMLVLSYYILRRWQQQLEQEETAIRYSA